MFNQTEDQKLVAALEAEGVDAGICEGRAVVFPDGYANGRTVSAWDYAASKGVA
jgi:hypothetical protein